MVVKLLVEDKIVIFKEFERFVCKKEYPVLEPTP